MTHAKLTIVAFLIAAGCRPAAIAPPRDTAPGDSDPVVVDTDRPTDDTGTEQIGTNAYDFSPTRIGSVAVQLSDEAITSLRNDPWTWVEGAATIDGSHYASVGVRLRGKYGAFRTIDQKPKLKIDFNRYVEGQRHLDLESMSLNNTVVDCSYLKETVAAEVYAAAGVIASRAGYTAVTVNDEAYGLYVVVETQDDPFLERHWSDDSGNLYDGKYWMDENWNYVLLDFGDGVDRYFDLEEGEDVGFSDIAAISEAVTAYWGSQGFYENTQHLLDWDSIHHNWAADQWVGQLDGYCLNRNNYRVYFDPDDGGRADLIPTDLDYAFIPAEDWWMDWDYPEGNLAEACLMDHACTAAWKDAVETLLVTLETTDWEQRAGEIWAVIESDAFIDTRRECSDYEVAITRDYLYDWVRGRSAELHSHWEL